MSLSQVETALTQAYIDLGLGIATSYPNRIFEAPVDDIWINLTFNPTDTIPVTAFRGQDNHTGFMQLDINVPQDTGTSDLRNIADQLQDYFTAGTSFVYTSQKVIINSTRLTPGRVVDNYYRISATVRWYARTNRTN